MSSFSFPPPPPPPPRASAPDNSSASLPSQRGAFRNNRGDRGGRGGNRGRGRGNSHGQWSGAPRGGHPGSNQHFHSSTKQTSQAAVARPQQQFQDGSAAFGIGWPASIPSGAYVNPSFVPNLQWNPSVQTSVSPATLVQAFSYMQSQSVNMTTNPDHRRQEPSPKQPSSPSLGKRKREYDNISGARSTTLKQPNQSKPKPQKAKVAVPPPVPSFGFALPTIPQPVPPQKPLEKKAQSKRKINLGLTPREGEDEQSDEEVDEEAQFNAEGAGMVFEHEGQKISLDSPVHVVAWLKERRKKFPTQARIAEKAREAAGRRARELETIRRVKGQAAKQPSTSGRDVPSKANVEHAKRAVEDEKRKQKIEKHQKKIEQLRKKLERSQEEAKPPSTAAQVQGVKAEGFKPLVSIPPSTNLDLGLNYDSDSSEIESHEGSISDISSVLSSSDPDSDADSDDASSSSSSDSAPEEESSKRPLASNRLPQNHSMAVQDKASPDVCPFWKRGNCRKGKNCNWPHPPKEPLETPKRMRLYDRLVEQEQRAADVLALQAIKYLGSNGFLD